MRTRSSRSPSLLLLVSLLAVGTSACKDANTTTPEDLRHAWEKALRDDDPEAAWQLLAPEARAEIGKDAFFDAWKADHKERAEDLQGLQTLGDAGSGEDEVLLSGRTTHTGGRELRWVRVGGRYLIDSGFPGQDMTLTAESTIRAFIAAIRAETADSLDGLVDPSMLERADQAWKARANAIEEALDRPGSLELSADYRRAVLHYEFGAGEGGRIDLERDDRGWRILDLR